MNTFKIKNGRWITGNLNDILVLESFFRFLRKHKKLDFLKKTVHKRGENLKRHNYKFKEQTIITKSQIKKFNDGSRRRSLFPRKCSGKKEI